MKGGDQVADELKIPTGKTPVEAYREVYEDTLYFVDGITSEYDFYPGILQMLRDGNLSVELKKRITLRAIEEMWVSTIEDALVALDNRIRKPSRFIEENEQVLPIELSKNINSRSIVHLAQHTDYISKVEGDTITPSKILNVFHDETVMTYENKFVNTLINRLFGFVARRYDALKKEGRSQKSTRLCFGGDFTHGELKGNIKFELELAETDPKEAEMRNPACSAELSDRVERLYEITLGYTNSDFAKEMGKAYVRPPIQRTNAILKNKDLKQCLALWEFIESYEETGYSVSVEEHAERADDSYIHELYSTCALQYLIFRYKIKNTFDDEATLSEAKAGPILPKFVTDIDEFNADDYNVFDSQYLRVVPYHHANARKRMSDSEKAIAHAIDVALAADDLFAELCSDEARARFEEDKRRAEEEQMRRYLEEQERLEAERLRREEEEARKKNEKLSRIKDKRIGRKKKKRIRKASELKAALEGVELPPVFNYVEYMRYLNR